MVAETLAAGRPRASGRCERTEALTFLERRAWHFLELAYVELAKTPLDAPNLAYRRVMARRATERWHRALVDLDHALSRTTIAEAA